MNPSMRPNNKEAEQALLGALLISPDIINKIDVEPGDFYYISHQDVYQAIKAIGDTADITSISDLLRRGEKLEEIGGTAFLLSLVNQCPSSYNYENYVKIVKDTCSRRRVIEHAESLAKVAFDETQPLSDAISIAVSSLVSEARPSGGAEHVSVYLKKLYEEVEERSQDPKEIYGLATGLRDFDLITKGFQKGEEFIIAGEPGVGKSLLAFQLVCGAAEHSPGVIYELEMTGLAILRRRVSADTKIGTDTMRSGVGMTEKWSEFARAVERVEKLKMFISDQSDWNTLQMRADLSRLKERHKIEWFMVDYMDLLTDSVSENSEKNSAYISRQLHGICKDLDLAGIVIHSMNKAGMEKLTPGMGSLSGSAKVAYDTDDAVTLTKDKDLKNVVNMTWIKQRESDGDRAIKLTKVPGLPLFAPYAPEEVTIERDNWWSD